MWPVPLRVSNLEVSNLETQTYVLVVFYDSERERERERGLLCSLSEGRAPKAYARPLWSLLIHIFFLLLLFCIL